MLIRIAVDAHRHLKYLIRVLITLVLFLLDVLGFYDKSLHYFHILDSEQEVVNAGRFNLKKTKNGDRVAEFVQLKMSTVENVNTHYSLCIVNYNFVLFRLLRKETTIAAMNFILNCMGDGVWALFLSAPPLENP